MQHRCLIVLATLFALVPLESQAQSENRTDRMLRERAALQASLDTLDSPEAKQAAFEEAMTDAVMIAYAESAGPYEVSSKAAILDPISGRELRAGSNGWTCIAVPGQPMCLDRQWMIWWNAVQSQDFSTDLDISTLGFAYMLAGDQGGPNVADGPFDRPTADNDWVITGPHLMLLSPDPALLDGLPVDPAAGGPFVMWRGSPLEHVMMPIHEGSVVMP